MAEQLPPLPVTKIVPSKESQAPIVLPRLEEQDEILQNHYLRVQEVIWQSADAKVKQIEAKAKHTEHALKQTLEEKTETNVSLYRTKALVTQLDKRLIEAYKNYNDRKAEKELLSSEKKIFETRCDALLRANNEDQKKIAESDSLLKAAQRRLEEAEIKIQQLHDINENYTDEIKIQKRINSKLVKEVETVSLKATLANEKLGSELEKNEILSHSEKKLQDLLAQQQTEVITAQAAIESLHKENSKLEKIRKSTEKQWEETLTAMSGRDKAIQNIQDRKETTELKLNEAQVENRFFKNQTSDLAARLSQKEAGFIHLMIECEELARHNANLQAHIKAVVKDYEDSKHTNMRALAAQKSQVSEIEALQTRVERTENELQHKLMVIAELKEKAHNATLNVMQQERIQISLVDAERREHKIRHEHQQHLSTVKREQESTSYLYRHEIASLKISTDQKESELDSLKNTSETLKWQNHDLAEEHSKLYDQVKQLNYALERKEHDLNLLNSKLVELEIGHQDSYNSTVTAMTSDNQKLMAEKDKLQKMFIEAQKALIREQEKYKTLQSEKDELQTRLGLAVGVKQRTIKEIDNVKNESFAQKQESAKFHSLLRKLQPVVDELKEQNLLLHQKLHEAEIKLEESSVNHQTTKHMLRTEIRRLANDRSKDRQARANYEKNTMYIERNTQLGKEKLDKLKNEKYALQREVFDLKRRADESDRKCFDMKIKLRQMEKLESNRAAASVGKLASGAPSNWTTMTNLYASHQENRSESHILDSHLPISKQEQELSAGERIMKEIPDFEAFRLKLDSLVNEKEYLFNENSGLKEQVHQVGNMNSLMMSIKLEEQSKSLQEHKAKLKENATMRIQQIDRITVLENRCNRATKVAALMERQAKQAKPNMKIVYQLLDNPDPSTQLLAAILTKDVPKNGVGQEQQLMSDRLKNMRKDTLHADP